MCICRSWVVAQGDPSGFAFASRLLEAVLQDGWALTGLTLFPQSTLAVWVKWPSHPSAPDLAGHKRQFGSVCHQDPRSVLLAPLLPPWEVGGEGVAAPLWRWAGGHRAGSDRTLGSCRVCDEPSSEDPHEWPDDITKWPVSRDIVGFGGHPCYVGEKSTLIWIPRGPTMGAPFSDAVPLACAWPAPPPPASLSRWSEQNQGETWEVRCHYFNLTDGKAEAQSRPAFSCGSLPILAPNPKHGVGAQGWRQPQPNSSPLRSRSAPKAAPGTTPTTPTWTAPSRAGPAALAPRAGGCAWARALLWGSALLQVLE